MRLARGVVVCLTTAVLTSPAAPAWAGTTTGDAATTNATATDTSTSIDTTTATTTELPATAAATDTTTPTDTSTSTDTAPATDTVAAIPVAKSIDRGCVFGGVALLLPNRTPLLIGPVADAPSSPVAAMSNLVYPADGSVVTAAGIALEAAGCRSGEPAAGKTEIRSLSLFGGTVTADTVGLTISDAGARHADAVSGLQVDGTAVQVDAGTHVPLGAWGYLVTGTLDRLRTTAASGSAQPPLRVQASALAVHLLESHGGLPAGSVLLISFAGLPGPAPAAAATPMPLQPATPVRVTPLAPKAAAKPRAAHRKHKGPLHHAPFRITPPLGAVHYVFPVTGTSSFVDTYGAFRGDVPGNWHHGDDVFAALGTPVVAVADGTVNRVGWQKIGGWRLWVDDRDGNRFYYAHLSGYAPAVIKSKTVKAGEVIGFVGNSGDAFTTSPHLHFEIHPQGLTSFGYDGAVDPTRYLQAWTHLTHVHAPRPTHPRLPRAAAARQEARYVFRELLAARGFLKKKPSAPPRQAQTTLTPDGGAPAVVTTAAPSTPKVVAASPVSATAPQALPATTTALAIGGSLVLLALSGSTLAVRRVRRRPAAQEVDDVHQAAAAALPAALEPVPVSARIAPRPVAGTMPPGRRGLPVSVIAGTGSLVALFTASVLLLRRRSGRQSS